MWSSNLRQEGSSCRHRLEQVITVQCMWMLGICAHIIAEPVMITETEKGRERTKKWGWLAADGPLMSVKSNSASQLARKAD